MQGLSVAGKGDLPESTRLFPDHYSPAMNRIEIGARGTMQAPDSVGDKGEHMEYRPLHSRSVDHAVERRMEPKESDRNPAVRIPN